MLTKIQKWGNSLALRIPKSFAVDAHLENNSIVDVSLVEGQIVIKPVDTPVWNLEQLLAGVTDANIHGAVDAGKPMGSEIW
jgi:antitoxin MazE